MRKPFIFLIHFGFWICYLIIILILLFVAYRNNFDVIEKEHKIHNALYSFFFFAFLPSIITYFTFYSFLFPRFVQHKKFFLSFLYGILIALIAAFVGYILLRYFIESGRIIDMDNGGINGRSTAFGVMLFMTFIGLICGIVALIINGFITWFNEMKLKDELKKQNHTMEMALIKSKLDPHLLFNTINNIDSLILKDAISASDYLNKLSDIIRFVLYETSDDKILLSQEIEYIEKYIALQKIRTSNEAYVKFVVDGFTGTKRVAPMVFIPFIENAFKHTNNKKLENAINIRIIINNETTQLFCENKYDSKLDKEHPKGLGNDLAQKRLELIYGDKQKLNVQKGDEQYTINLTVPNE